jgi:L-alanine-DL-glutamate epimerase-like enolase superfamily enzyme
MSYGRMGVVINAISAVDLALWDIVGKALNMPVYKQRGSRFEYRNVQSAGRATGRHDRACLGDAI